MSEAGGRTHFGSAEPQNGSWFFLCTLLVFASLTVLFFLLAAGDAMDSAAISKLAEYEGIVCGFSAIYAGLAQVLNEAHGKTVLPLCPVK